MGADNRRTTSRSGGDPPRSTQAQRLSHPDPDGPGGGRARPGRRRGRPDRAPGHGGCRAPGGGWQRPAHPGPATGRRPVQAGPPVPAVFGASHGGRGASPRHGDRGHADPAQRPQRRQEPCWVRRVRARSPRPRPAAWPATPRCCRWCWAVPPSPWTWDDEPRWSRRPYAGRSCSGTSGAGSLPAPGLIPGATPTTRPTGPTVGRRLLPTWCCCAGPTTAWCTRAGSP